MWRVEPLNGIFDEWVGGAKERGAKFMGKYGVNEAVILRELFTSSR
jgi:hypothetical protein